MEGKKTSGSCLCGSVTYEYSGAGKVFQYCHCSRCRKFTGSAFSPNIIVEPSQFEWLSGAELLGRFELPEAKHFATCFCKNCGSSLPWITKSGKAVIIPAGTLDSDPGEKPIHNIYTSNQAPWFLDAGDLVKYEELPLKKRQNES